ncbi:hypothetical protein RJT34_11432 [Clitoria ternatea]|uniref:Uncharacterized protein n=1 Tax=Clitoria ternatea TaxID=43366 RepID=A0AAN9JJX2_CLITE
MEVCLLSYWRSIAEVLLNLLSMLIAMLYDCKANELGSEKGKGGQSALLTTIPRQRQPLLPLHLNILQFQFH